jgi:hypothetical protein
VGESPKSEFEVVADKVLWFVQCADEDEAALEDGEVVVGEGGQVYGQGGRMLLRPHTWGTAERAAA